MPAPMISTTAAMPGAWLRGLQHDGLRMTGCFLADSVKHATHLFLDSAFRVVLCGWPGWRTVTPPGPARLPPRAAHIGAPGRFADDVTEHEQVVLGGLHACHDLGQLAGEPVVADARV